MVAPLPLVLAALLVASPADDPPPAASQPPVALQTPAEPEVRDEDDPEVRELTVSPAPLPDPPLKYRLTIPAEDRLPGSAVTFWYRAELLLAEDETIRARNADGEPAPPREQIARELLDEPPAALTAERIERDLKLPSDWANGWESWPLFAQMEAAARRPPGDWGFGVKALPGKEVLDFRLPEFQNARGLAGLMVLRGRSRVGRSDFEGALADAAVALRFAEDLGRAPFFVGDLVGLAVGSAVHERLTEAVIAAPDSPNLYHALTVLPDPAAGLADSLEFELNAVARLAPWLKDPETRERSAEQWREAWIALHEDFYAWTFRGGKGRDAAAATDQLLASQAPTARSALIDAGWDPAEVKAMPVGQAVAVYQSRELRRVLDAYEFAVALPPREALDAFDRIEETTDALRLGAGIALDGVDADDRPQRIWPTIQWLPPVIREPYLAGVLARTDLAALRVVEALRAHAAETGSFPKRLDEIAVVPVPDNPLTGEPFGYRLEDATAVLEVVRDPTHGSPDQVLRLRLRGE